MMTVGSLFSGIGGLDLGLERAGMSVIWQSEIDPYASKVLARHWPTVPNLGDITTIDWSSVERPDLICGGYPCQPFSTAGKRDGADDRRHLWPLMRDAIRALRPGWAVMENVSGHLSLGFGDVLGDLAAIGYDAEWDCVSASSVGAPHQRYRVFIVAYPHGSRRAGGTRIFRAPRWGQSAHGGREMADAAQLFGDGSDHHAGSLGEGTRTGGNLPEPRDGRGAARPDGGWWSVEPDVGRVAHGVPSRVDRLRALGNAVVPQVAEHVGRLILEAAA